MSVKSRGAPWYCGRRWQNHKGSSFSEILGIIHTFIIKRIVLNTMSVMMKYSNGVDSTILHSLYLTPTLSSGMYLSSGVALMAKSMHDFCKFIVTVLYYIQGDTSRCPKPPVDIITKVPFWPGCLTVLLGSASVLLNKICKD